MKEPTGDEKKKEQVRLDVGKKAKGPPPPPNFSLRAKLVETALSPEQREFFVAQHRQSPVCIASSAAAW